MDIYYIPVSSSCDEIHAHVHVLMRDEKEGRSKQGQTNNKAKQHSTPKAVTFPIYMTYQRALKFKRRDGVEVTLCAECDPLVLLLCTYCV